jgi:hypothetical protein
MARSDVSPAFARTWKRGLLDWSGGWQLMVFDDPLRYPDSDVPSIHSRSRVAMLDQP